VKFSDALDVSRAGRKRVTVHLGRRPTDLSDHALTPRSHRVHRDSICLAVVLRSRFGGWLKAKGRRVKKETIDQSAFQFAS
jgi:hypothetical protein